MSDSVMQRLAEMVEAMSEEEQEALLTFLTVRRPPEYTERAEPRPLPPPRRKTVITVAIDPEN